MVNTHTFSGLWGDNYIFTPINKGLKGSILGWRAGLGEGDYVILKNGDKTTRYQIEEISYYSDPTDMFKASVKFAPRG